MKKRHALLLLGLLPVLMLFPGCSRDQATKAGAENVSVERPADPNTFTVDKPEQFPLVTAETRSVQSYMDVTGVVAPDVARTVPVLSLSGGRAIEIHARLGDYVEKGKLLLRIHSSDLAVAISDHQKAMADEVLARRAQERARELFQHGAMAEKDKEAAEDAEQKALVDVKTTAEKIRILGGSLDHPSPILDVKAPVTGTIIEQNIQTSGGVKSLDNSPNLFTIADLSRVWILCDVYENNLSHVHLGDFAEVRMNAYPDRMLKGRVSNISSMLDPATRTAKIRLEVANPSKLLRPGMFGTARFETQKSEDRVVVPATAILRLHDKDWVFRPAGNKQFHRVEIQTGPVMSDGYQQVLSGLQPGDAVVSNVLQLAGTIQAQQ
jgi:membrane fusion protein, heavy metal efflux system